MCASDEHTTYSRDERNAECARVDRETHVCHIWITYMRGFTAGRRLACIRTTGASGASAENVDCTPAVDEAGDKRHKHRPTPTRPSNQQEDHRALRALAASGCAGFAQSSHHT